MSEQAFLAHHKRTHYCGELRETHVGSEVTLLGWVHNRRDHGGCIFIDLRDREGVAQIVFDPEIGKDSHAAAERIRGEFVLAVRGKVRSRGTNVNPRLPTGAVEVAVVETMVLNTSETPPFMIEDDIDTAEEKRLLYRYLDLRRPSLQRNFLLRNRLNQVVRNHMAAAGFLELETPVLTKSTPEGARDYLVPSRVHPGHFFALPQSPQLFKQLFMVAGFDRYFQIVKCFRDEDLRADRQPEFTQIDIEMSFVTPDDVMNMAENLCAAVFEAGTGTRPETPFRRMAYREAMDKYGVDRPDLRFDLPLTDLTEKLRALDGAGVPFFRDALETGGIVKALRVPNPPFSRTEIDKLEGWAKHLGAKGLARAKIAEDGSWAQSPLSKVLTDAGRQAINAACGAQPGDFLFFQFGEARLVNTVLAALRVEMAQKLNLIDANRREFLWVTDFPMFEFDPAEKRYAACHHPFTRPADEDLDKLTTDPGSVRALAYDLVLNGNEIAGGSIRIHNQVVQQKVFDALGIGEAEARVKFGFLLDALKFGAPPHGGIAFGLDRLAMLICGTDSIRDVIPFPKTQKATCLMTEAPSEVSARQLEELWISKRLPV